MNQQKKSNLLYSNLAVQKKIFQTDKAGRYKWQKGKEKLIFNDIKKKLIFKKNDKFLDIGCGWGPLTDLLVNFCQKKKVSITLCDIPLIIKILKNKYKNFENIKYISKEFQKTKINQKYDKILCYSVIQCVDSPLKFSKKIILLLNKEGKTLIGDIPNINKKYRFLKSSFGIKYEKMSLKNNIKYKNFSDFKKKTKQNKKLNDDYILNILNFCRKNNRSSNILSQNPKLPFSFTREDILIEEF